MIKRAKQISRGKSRVHRQTRLRPKVDKFVVSESKKRNKSISETIDILLYDLMSA